MSKKKYKSDERVLTKVANQFNLDRRVGECVSKSEKIKEHKFMRTTFHIKSTTNHAWFQAMETKLVDLIREIRLAGSMF